MRNGGGGDATDRHKRSLTLALRIGLVAVPKRRFLLAGWRKTLFIIALIANAVSAAVLLSFIIHGRVVMANVTKGVGSRPSLSRVVHARGGTDQRRSSYVRRRVSRLLLIGGGLFVVLLWYFAALAASP